MNLMLNKYNANLPYTDFSIEKSVFFARSRVLISMTSAKGIETTETIRYYVSYA